MPDVVSIWLGVTAAMLSVDGCRWAWFALKSWHRRRTKPNAGWNKNPKYHPLDKSTQ